ncbi:hypothetical protein [Heyndrickxia coagulans]|uniref:hypothetical protein n=1 Tax=Heyndrickxia coagulans TaxID=1398 RepID=UPI00047BDF4D|nr:hypothetical protein [Heyndrickxia coagulans]
MPAYSRGLEYLPIMIAAQLLIWRWTSFIRVYNYQHRKIYNVIFLIVLTLTSAIFYSKQYGVQCLIIIFWKLDGNHSIYRFIGGERSLKMDRVSKPLFILLGISLLFLNKAVAQKLFASSRIIVKKKRR